MSVLEALAKDTYYGVRASVAANPSTPASLLEALAKNKARSVREAVAENSATPARVLEALARDMTQEVRSSVAIKHLDTPERARGVREGRSNRSEQCCREPFDPGEFA